MTLWTESTDDRSLQEVMTEDIGWLSELRVHDDRSLQEVMTEDIGWHSELRVHMTYVYRRWWQRTLDDILNWEYRWQKSTGGDERGHWMTLWTESTDDRSLQEVMPQRTLDDILNWEYRWHKSTGGDDRGHWMTLWTESTDDISLQEVMTEDIEWHSELRVQMTEVYRRWWQRTLDDTLNWEYRWQKSTGGDDRGHWMTFWTESTDDIKSTGGDDRGHWMTLWTESTDDRSLQEVMTEDIGWHSELRVQMTEVYRRWCQRTLDDILNWEYRWHKSTGGDDRGHWMTFWTESTDDRSLQEVMTEDIGWRSQLK